MHTGCVHPSLKIPGSHHQRSRFQGRMTWDTKTWCDMMCSSCNLVRWPGEVIPHVYVTLLVFTSRQLISRLYVGYWEYICLAINSVLVLIKQCCHFDTLRLGVDGYCGVSVGIIRNDCLHWLCYLLVQCTCNSILALIVNYSLLVSNFIL